MRECTVNRRFRQWLRHPFLILLWVLATLAITGCGRTDTETQPKKDKRLEPITNEDFSKLRMALEQAIAERNRSRIVSLFSKPQLFKIVFNDLDISTSLRRKLESNINRGGNLAALISGIFGGLDNGGEYEFVKRLESDGGCAMLFRFIKSNGNEIAYHRFDVCRGYKARVVIRDVYLYLEQESMSNRLRQRVLLELENIGELKSKSGTDLEAKIETNPLQADSYNKFLELASSENWQEAWVQFEKLPQAARRTTKAAYRRIIIAERLGDIYVNQAIQDARESNSSNLRTEYFAYNYYRKRQDHNNVILAVDRLLDVVDDPYLQLLKLEALIATGKVDVARTLMDEYLAIDSKESKRILVHQFELANAERQFESCIQIMNKLKSTFGVSIKNLSELPRYDALLKSTEYEKWIAESN